MTTDQLTRIREKISSAGKSLGSVLTEGELAEFEAQHRITLPSGYRDFLAKVGNGGTGPPAYGLKPLNHWDKHEERRPTQLQLPFPFTKPWCWEGDEVSDEGTMEQIGHGALFLGTDGCGMDWHVIVTGFERGNVWMITGEGICPTTPKRDFLKWYEDWLDGVENMLVVE